MELGINLFAEPVDGFVGAQDFFAKFPVVEIGEIINSQDPSQLNLDYYQEMSSLISQLSSDGMFQEYYFSIDPIARLIQAFSVLLSKGETIVVLSNMMRAFEVDNTMGKSNKEVVAYLKGVLNGLHLYD